MNTSETLFALHSDVNDLASRVDSSNCFVGHGALKHAALKIGSRLRTFLTLMAQGVV